MDSVTFSVVVPVFNEEANLFSFHERLAPVLQALEDTYEIIFVDDGSCDGSGERLRELRGRDPCVKVVELSRNFGHQAALSAGLDHASGRATITIDGDLQHPPELIAELVAKWREGYEVVYTVRESTAGAGWFKEPTSRAFYAVLERLAGVSIHGRADFRLLDRRALESIRSMPERARFVRGLVSWIGFRSTGIHYSAAPRHGGISKYDTVRMLLFALDGLLSFSRAPLRVASILGLLVTLGASIYAAYAVGMWLFTDLTQPGWASILVAVLILGGIQLVVMGIIGEYLGRVYDEVKQRPLYIVEEAIGFPDAVPQAAAPTTQARH